MKRVSVTTLKNQLSKYLRLVKRGETIEVLEHSVPIARIHGVGDSAVGDERLQRLLRDGVATRARETGAGRGPVSKPPIPSRKDPVRALVEGRGGR